MLSSRFNNLSESKFEFAFAFTNNGIDLLEDGSYVTVNMNWVNQTWATVKG